MVKNGLFIASIGFIIIMLAVNPTSLEYDLLSMTTGVFLVAVGGYFFFKGRKKDAAEKKKVNN
ncbi:hypothetical protein RU97_GL000466 [Enterococcus canis]|uniref:DUF3188 domain-containing protein n=1 Tax=Enterococcus canis TaxID=214095 RepID=A0A1L8RKE0_9ENTE|nr:DUF3188 domain-containing protein [Enterococcus canis]OJG20233.1 hypothetical protein RU97_GL000466 [Enterococcus canis]